MGVLGSQFFVDEGTNWVFTDVLFSENVFVKNIQIFMFLLFNPKGVFNLGWLRVVEGQCHSC